MSQIIFKYTNTSTHCPDESLRIDTLPRDDHTMTSLMELSITGKYLSRIEIYFFNEYYQKIGEFIKSFCNETTDTTYNLPKYVIDDANKHNCTKIEYKISSRFKDINFLPIYCVGKCEKYFNNK